SGKSQSGWEVFLDHDAERLHALMRKNGESWYLDPDGEAYKFAQHTSPQVEEALCLADEKTLGLPPFPQATTAAKNGLAKHYIFRCAIGATAEYTAYHGGTKALAMAEIVSVLNRVNAVFRKDVAISFQLVANNDQIVFTNPLYDPFSNGDLNSMIQENQNLLDLVIGDANYDVGIVFGQVNSNGGAIAYYNSVCQSGFKGQAAIAVSNPIGDGFAIDFVAHEFGHFFGAHHTHNNPCYRYAPTAYEPRSGSTIMAYAGVCSPSLQPNSDDYFHAASIDEIRQAVNSGFLCGQTTSVSNQAPIVIVNQPIDYLPIATPFALEGYAIDAEGDSISYNWEQWDLGSPGQTNAHSAYGPIIRSRPAQAHGVRIVPQLAELLTGQHSQQEFLPRVSRNLRFRLTATDHHPTATQMGRSYVNLKVTNQAGPFRMYSPANHADWKIGSMQWVKWDVAKTDLAPVNCDKVDIWLSTDGGYKFNTLLASNVANNGAYPVMVPDLPTQSARIKVSAANNIFFAIGESDFAISSVSQPDYYLFNIGSMPEVCQGDSIAFRLWLGSLGGYQGDVSFSLLEASIPVQWHSNNPLATASFLEFSIKPGDQLSGWQNITLLGIEPNGDSSLFNYSYYVVPAEPAAVDLLYPPDGQIQSDPFSNLKWVCQGGITAYYWELATHPSFGGSVVANGWSEDSLSANLPSLAEGTVYYWRVKGENACGEGRFSRVASFATPGLNCQTYWSNDVPKTIPINVTPAIANSELQIDDDFTITDINVVGLKGIHSWINDLKVKLRKDSVSVRLFDQICGPNVADFDLSFDDDVPYSSIPCPPTTGSTYQALDSLSHFDGMSSKGLWHLNIKDVVDLDGGELQAWGLQVCYQTDESLPPTVLANEGLNLNQWQVGMIDSSLLMSVANCGPNDIVYTLVEQPQYGSLKVDGTILSIGDTFLQSAINDQLLQYQHQGQAASRDGFSFTVRSHDGGWLGTPYFPISINLTTSLEETESVAAPSLYPNPAEDHFFVEFAEPLKDAGNLMLFDLQGRLLYEEAFSTGVSKLKVSSQNLASGLYLVRLSYQGQSHTLRCLIQ
ncbi:MAG: reprolysin-like metallopeptidase, partial [Bacteroidota bacterium]